MFFSSKFPPISSRYPSELLSTRKPLRHLLTVRKELSRKTRPIILPRPQARQMLLLRRLVPAALGIINFPPSPLFTSGLSPAHNSVYAPIFGGWKIGAIKARIRNGVPSRGFARRRRRPRLRTGDRSPRPGTSCRL
jgi:hypothetical protein